MDRGSSAYDSFDVYRYVPAATYQLIEARLKRLKEIEKGHPEKAGDAKNMIGDGDLASAPPKFLENVVAQTLSPSTASAEMTTNATEDPNTDIELPGSLGSVPTSETKKRHSTPPLRSKTDTEKEDGEGALKKESDKRPRPPYYLEGPFNFRDKHDW